MVANVLRVAVLGASLFQAACASWAQPAWRGPLVYPEKLRADLELMRGMVHQVHPDPYRYRTRAALDRIFDEVIGSIVVPMDEETFLQRTLPVWRAIGDANMVVERSGTARETLLRHTPILPLKVRVIDNALYVDEELRGFRSLPVGSRIRSVNGVVADTLLARTGALVITDGANESSRWRIVERDLPLLLLRAFGDTTSYRIVVDAPDGVKDEQVLFAITGDEIERSRKPAIDVVHPWTSEWEPAIGTLWVTFSTLEKSELQASGQDLSRFLDDMLRDARQNNARHLVLDLRGAGGSELGVAELVFATIAREPFRVVQGMYVRSGSPPEGYVFAEPQPEHYASVNDNYLADVNGVSYLRPDDDRLEMMAPSSKAFGGKVYVLCDGGTRDAAAALVMLAKRHARASVVGEETGTNAFKFTGGRRLIVAVPNSGLRLHIPLVAYLPDGAPEGPMDHGEQPHHAAQQEPWGIAVGRDTVRSSLLRMIKELQ